jgi:hypothetical protein
VREKSHATDELIMRGMWGWIKKKAFFDHHNAKPEENIPMGYEKAPTHQDQPSPVTCC